jgi:DNA (cytosine-5)-methyltransferase 1
MTNVDLKNEYHNDAKHVLQAVHLFPYRWNLKDANFTKDKGKVFSCFACGGGSTMGYKLAGFDVLGCNEIEAYKTNHNPKYAYLEPIQTFKLRKDLPKELYELDILDGSPPCSSFSMAGNREKDWGKEKKFREGQAEQILDNLFFDFIDLAKKLQPKVVIAENVKGLLLGNAKQYVRQIYREFDLAGYYCQHWLLDASKMGVPQKRERVFFIAMRKDLAEPFLYNADMFTIVPKLELDFKEKEITFEEIADNTDLTIKDNTEVSKYYDLVDFGQSFSTKHPKGHFFHDYKANPKEPLNTICADPNHGAWHPTIKRMINFNEAILGGSYAMDYNFVTNNPKYLIGMSVPPVMTAQIATEIYNQWLSKL